MMPSLSCMNNSHTLCPRHQYGFDPDNKQDIIKKPCDCKCHKPKNPIDQIIEYGKMQTQYYQEYQMTIDAKIDIDNHGPYIDFGPLRFRPSASNSAPGQSVRCFNKARNAAGHTMFLSETVQTVSPAYKVETGPDGVDCKQSYLVVYNKERRELWCSHGFIDGGGWDPLAPLPGVGPAGMQKPTLWPIIPRLKAWMVQHGVIEDPKAPR